MVINKAELIPAHFRVLFLERKVGFKEVITIQCNTCFDRDNKAMRALTGKIPEAEKAQESNFQQTEEFKMAVEQREWAWK